MRVTIEFEPGARPIAGRLERAGQPAQEFEGMLELISLLEALTGRPAREQDRFGVRDRPDAR